MSQPLLHPVSTGFEVAPWRLSGVVYGALLNHAPQLAALGAAAEQAPYKGAPRAPVLQVRPRNTLCGPGSVVGVPGAVEVGASLGIVIGRTACRVTADEAEGVVAGYLVAAELSLPSDSHYRPAVRLKARDGFTVLGPVVPAAEVDDPDALALQLVVNGQTRLQGCTGDRVRGVARLIADVTEFMTLSPGDVLLLGAESPAPQAQSGDRITLGLEGLGALSFSLAPEAVPAVPAAGELRADDGTELHPRGPRARVAYGGAVHEATPHPQGLRLADGRVLREDQVQWLPPFEVGTILALGLNYADHLKELSKELTITTQDEPLVFLKGPGALVGHRGHTRRPAGVAFMHYECELAVVIGKTAKHVAARDAMAHVAGYTVCNDYAIRDHLENWYRPNLRVKNRDGATALGPWFVPAADVADPHALALRTWVNGQRTQQGTTAHMVNDIPALIEYLSSFMTLQAGDVILTGTPEGVVNVNEGDEVVCEIDGIGRLVNHIVGDAVFGR